MSKNNYNQNHLGGIGRRDFLRHSGAILASAGMAALLPTSASAFFGSARPAALTPPPVPGLMPKGKAKRVIHLFMAGGFSQLDTFDYKPGLTERFDQDLPDSIRMGQRITTMTSGQDRLPIAPSTFKFQQYGQSGAWISELLPHIGGIADKIAIVRSVHTEAINHDPAITFTLSGHQLPGRPSLGSWMSYGMESQNEDLPNFVVMTPTWTGRSDAQALYSRLWGTGFLPTQHQGVALRAQGDPILYLSDPPGIDRDSRRAMLDSLNALNQQRLEKEGDPEIATRMAQYEMAHRMQASVPELTDISDEPKEVLDLYGPEVTKPGTFAHSCLLARRMAERGVMCIQSFIRGWDHHGALPSTIRRSCHDIDQPSAGLIMDLEQKGMLDETLVVFGTEFGRTVYCQGKLTLDDHGRDHHPRCFSYWLAGGGIKGGVVHGETDDFSYNIIKDPVHLHDINATILHCLGMEHTRLTYRHQGRDFRLTDVGGSVVHPILT